MRQLRVFRRLLALNVGVTLRYRGEFVIMQVGGLIVPITSLLVWQAALAAGADLPVDGRATLLRTSCWSAWSAC